MSTQLSSKQLNRTTSKRGIRLLSGHHFYPYAFVLILLCSYFAIDAVLPLYGLWFHTASLTALGSWTLLPTRLLFPGWQLTPTLVGSSNGIAPPLILSWVTAGLFLLTLLVAFSCYLAALRMLPVNTVIQPATRTLLPTMNHQSKHRGFIGLRFLVLSTALFGLVLLFAPTVTSQDIYSYIIYARMQVLYHLNPLITSPMSVMHDPTYIHLYWINQPSAYGPTWLFLTGGLQWLTGIFNTASPTPMILALRLLNLLAHLGSTVLLWLLSGRLQQAHGYKNDYKRVLATMAFAWNPLLLFEACVNGHNDTVMLFLVLIALWYLLRLSGGGGYMLATFILALATCLKVNAVLLLPGLLLFVWLQQERARFVRIVSIALMLLVYVGTIIALYTPFWSHGRIFLILQMNPGTSRATNSIVEFLGHLYDSLVTHSAVESGFAAETITRFMSESLFIIAYLILCWHTLRKHVFNPHIAHREGLPYLGMIRWMAYVWLLYCLLGSPWFWPWYLTIFFGLFALLEALSDTAIARLTPATRLLAFSMLSLYCSYAWSVYGSFIPFLFHFRWAYLRGLWVWLLPCIAFVMPFSRKGSSSQSADVRRKSTI